MNRESRPHVLDLNSAKPIRSRSSTSSLDTPYCPLQEVSPEPAFIAQAAAAQIVTSSHAGFLGGVNGGTQTTPVTAPALRIVNQFLDYLLYSFLASARSISLPALRSAIISILKKKLAGDAILGADEELHSYLGATDEEDVYGLKQHEAGDGDWDVERAWKQVRVRCMVYSSLGDLEEEDDDEGDQGVVSPAVAIWLAAILESVGEQTLLIAGQASLTRYFTLRAASVAAEEQASDFQTVLGCPMVEGLDTEKVALNPSLGRIWRQWRKHTRSTSSTMSMESLNHHFSNNLSASKTLGGSGFNTIAEGAASLPASRTSRERRAPSLDSAVTSLGVGELDRNAPDLEEDQLTDTDGKNPPTPQCLNGAPDADVTEFEGDNTDLELWLMKYGGDHRPRSMIMFPWTVSSLLDFPMDLASVKRPRSLPPLDTNIEKATYGTVGNPAPENRLVDGDIDSLLDIHHPEVARSKIDKMMDRINMVTYEQAELQKQLASEKDFHSQVLGSPETIIASALQKGLAVNTVDVDDTDFGSEAPEGKQVIDPVPASNYARAVLPTEIAVTSMGRPKRRVKGKSSKLSLSGTGTTDATGCDKNTNGPPKLSCDHIASNEVFTAVTASFDDDVPTPVAGTRKDKNMTLAIISPSPTLPQPSPSRSKPPSPSGSVQQLGLESRKGSVSSSIYSSQSTPSTASGGYSSGIRMLGPSSYGDDLRPSSCMSKILPRAIHTSGSITSVSSHRLKPFMTWPTDSGKRKETDDYNLPRRPKTTDDKARSFEQLIQSGGTIVCTLTPNEIRDIEAPLHPPAYKVEDLAEYIRNATPERAETPRSRSVATKSVILPRDARVDDTSSSRDLALFLSSTGPPQLMDNQPKAITPQSTQDTTLKTPDLIDTTSHLSSPRVTAPPLSPTLTLPTVINLQKVDVSPSTIPSHNKRRLIAREATGSTGDSTSILADFFRNTLPPMEGENVVQHRIPRSVAPFRTTLDSDRFDLDIPSDAVTRPLLESITDSASTVAESYQSSMASSTGLLSNSPNRRERQRWTAPLGGPIRKQVRGTELFTDDDLDIGSDIDLILPPLPRQDSFADFLRNVPPPHPNHPKPTQLNGASNKVKRNSAANLINRLSRTHSVSSQCSEKTPMYRPLPVRSDLFDTPLYESRLQTVPTEFGNRPIDTTYSHMTTNVSERPSPSRVKPVGEARSARVEQSKGIDELAAFLRDSAPPNMGPAPDRRLDVKEREEGNTGKFRFRSKGKRKEVVV